MLQTSKDLFAYVRRYPVRFLIGLVGLVISAFATTQGPRIIGNAIDAFQQGTMTRQSIWLYIGALIGVIATASAAMIIVRRTILNASWEIQFDIRHDLFDHFTRLSTHYYDHHRVGDLMARLTADLNAVRLLVGVAVFQGANTLLLLGFTLYRMFTLNVTLTLLTLLVVPLITVSFFVLLRIIHRRYQRVQEQFSDVSAMAQENFSGIRVVKGFGIEDREVSNFKRLNDEFIRRNLLLTRADGPLFPLMELLFGVALSVLLLVGGRFVIGLGGNLSVGNFIDFVLLFEGIQWPLIALGWIANIVQRGDTSWRRLREILDHEPAIQDTAQTNYNLTSIRGEIEFENVSYDVGDTRILDDVSFRIRAGETLGVAGRTGAGKTTLVNLIARLVEPTEGRILIDGIDIRHYPLEVLRRHLGIVPQEPFLFSDTIAENIAYGVPQGDPDGLEHQIREVAQLVQLAGDVEDFPEGYQTSLGERGVTLSGGQRQRTAMARAIIRDPAVLILDDALSAVDTQTEARILEGLEQVARDRTTLIVAHRVSAFQHAHRIVVLEAGRVVEQGSHDQLLAADGWYADMDRRQQLEASLESA
ncbi:MAG: ABC transporter ATP-binding protein [Trueperaceae bacterium]|nr:ABC transporter ATP-binding protein [Trueperaceae bacterium]